MTHSLETTLDRYTEAWNRHDVEGILALHTEDSVFENHTSGGKAVGLAELRALLESIFSTLPDLSFEGRRRYIQGDVAVVEWTAHATFCRPITRGGSSYLPTGERLVWNGLDVIPTREGKVAGKHVYADSISFLRQIGVEVP
jgi:steroid delta-isomerase-like uncharacterized protein